MTMNFKNFIDTTPERATRERKKKNKIFVTVKPKGVAFSRGSVDALVDVPYVRMMTDVGNKQILFLAGDSGLHFMKEGKRTQGVIWYNNTVLSNIKAMLPDGKKENVRILGEVVEIDGKKGILLDCNSLDNMRSLK